MITAAVYGYLAIGYLRWLNDTANEMPPIPVAMLALLGYLIAWPVIR